MVTKFLIVCVFTLSLASCIYGRDLLIEVLDGKVKRMDTFSTDAYLSVTVCNQKKQTPVVRSSLSPVWHWRHQYTNVRENCDIKFHLYDEETLERDDSMGEYKTTVGRFLAERQEQSSISFGKKGESTVRVRVRYV